MVPSLGLGVLEEAQVMLDDERRRLARQAGEGDLQAALRLISGLIRQGRDLGGANVWRIRRKSDGMIMCPAAKFSKLGGFWHHLSGVMSHLEMWLDSLESYGNPKRYDGCELVRYVTLEISAEDISSICEKIQVDKGG